MEANPPGIENSNLISWSSDDYLQNSSSHVKSYTCAFCKRGFSNAQALGGHMNIHRRDRAKLRQFAEENLLSLDITKTNPTEPPDASEEKMDENISQSSEEKSCTPKRTGTLSRADHYIEEFQQLPFFAETSSVCGDVKASSSTKENEEKMNHLCHSHSSQIELDLELRLGPEPDHDQPSGSITKEFF